MSKNNASYTAPPTPWHVYSVSNVLDQLDSNLEGLDELEVAQRQKKDGMNRLPGKPIPGLFSIFLSQFKNPFIYILIIAGAISMALKEYTDTIFIFAVLMLNAVIGSFQEWRAEKNAASLQKLLKIDVKVKRNGKDIIIDAESLVRGDIVYLESGNLVPADIRILSSSQLRIDESLLTGESMAVDKNNKPIEEDLPVSDRKNMSYAGSTVMNGRGIGVVVAIGHLTEVGNIARTVIVSTALKPPLVIRMEKFSRQVALLMLGATGLLATIAFFQGVPSHEIFFFAVALAVSSIPEGLPVAITVALAIATNRMAKRNVIVRKLTAVEGLGSCTFIASDKTGTLTVNKQTVKRVVLPEYLNFEVTGEGYNGDGTIINKSNGEKPNNGERDLLKVLCKAASICNDSNLKYEKERWLHFGNAVDLAMLALTYKNGQDPHVIKRPVTILKELPFDSERKYAATFYENEEGKFTAVKGAPEMLFPLCESMITTKGAVPIDAQKLERQAEELTEQGYRVIAIAVSQKSSEPEQEITEESEDIPPLTFLGLVGLIDPLRPEVKQAVNKCRGAGVNVAIVTGDHPLTALAIAKELGIAEDIRQVITGKQLTEISTTINEEFIAAVKGKKVFARVSPLQKMYITEALSKIGHFVAVTGDGVNDVPALKKSNIGVAMGSGTDLAKETAEIIIADDNFTSIEAGIEGGRFAYDNIRKVTYLLISTGAAEIILFLLSLLAGLPLPLTAVQLLWLNLVTNGIQDMALAFEGGEPETMQHPPRKPSEGIFNRLMIQQTIISGITIGLLAFGTWKWMLYQGIEEFHARTILLMLMVFMQNVHVFNCRSEYLSAFKVPLKRNWFIVAGVLSAQLIHVIASNIPFMQKVLHTDSVNFIEWINVFAISIGVLVVMEIFKIILNRRIKKA